LKYIRLLTRVISPLPPRLTSISWRYLRYRYRPIDATGARNMKSVSRPPWS
jgi:hypothetical protein